MPRIIKAHKTWTSTLGRIINPKCVYCVTRGAISRVNALFALITTFFALLDSIIIVSLYANTLLINQYSIIYFCTRCANSNIF